jgi:hypothetical protein
MKGNAVGLITALLTALVVLWQGYEEYKKEHPAPVTHVVQKPVVPEPTPIYWHDGTTWRCQVGDKQYVWVNNSQQTMPTQRVAAKPGSMVY